MIKLVHVVTAPVSLFFFKGQVGFLRQHGFDIEAVASPGRAADRFHESTGIPVFGVPMERPISPGRDGAALFRLWRLLRRLKPDIVHAHTPKAGLLGTLAARFAGVRIVYLSVFGLPQMTRSGISRKVLDSATWLSCRLADRIWSDSPSMREYLAKVHICPISKSFVLGQGSVAGVDANEIFTPILHEPSRAEIRARYGIPFSAAVIGFVGRIVFDKGMRELAEAWKILKNGRPDVHLLIVGEFEEHDPLPANVETLFRMDPRVHLTGWTEEVAPYYAAMDIYAMPSYREGFSVTNIEAAAMGLPVVATKIPGCVDSVQDGITGTLVPPRDAEALAAALRRYVVDPELRGRHGQAGRARVLRDFIPETIYEGLLNEYRNFWDLAR